MNREELKKGFKQDLKSHIYFNVNNQTKNDFGALKKDVLMYINNLIKKVNNGFCEIFGITIELTEQEKKGTI